jgi:putative transposase
VGIAHPTPGDINDMSNYRRSLTTGGIFFFTVVTYRRRPFLIDSFFRKLLREAIADVRKTQPFSIDAWVLLPDHLYCIWTLPVDDNDYSKRWGRIKTTFSKQAKQRLYLSKWMNESKLKHGESTNWQRRFWEHEIKDESDFNNHIDYIHYNPVKHGLENAVKDWPFSSFHRYVKNGIYSVDWASSSLFEPKFGE